MSRGRNRAHRGLATSAYRYFVGFVAVAMLAVVPFSPESAKAATSGTKVGVVTWPSDMHIDNGGVWRLYAAGGMVAGSLGTPTTPITIKRANGTTTYPAVNLGVSANPTYPGIYVTDNLYLANNSAASPEALARYTSAAGGGVSFTNTATVDFAHYNPGGQSDLLSVEIPMPADASITTCGMEVNPVTYELVIMNDCQPGTRTGYWVLNPGPDGNPVTIADNSFRWVRAASAGLDGGVVTDMTLDAAGNIYNLSSNNQTGNILRTDGKTGVVTNIGSYTGTAGGWSAEGTGLTFYNGSIINASTATSTPSLGVNPMTLQASAASNTDWTNVAGFVDPNYDAAGTEGAVVVDFHVVDGGGTPLANQKVGIYRADGTYVSTRTTDSNGFASTMLDSSNADFYFRVVRPTITTSGQTKNAEVTSINTTFTTGLGQTASTLSSSGGDNGANPADATNINVTTTNDLAKYSVRDAKGVGDVTFTVKAEGSTADLNPNATLDNNGPQHVNNGDVLKLGSTNGSYLVGATGNTHASDDGVSVSIGGASQSPNNQIFAVNGNYTFNATSTGIQAGSAIVHGWASTPSATAGGGDWTTSLTTMTPSGTGANVNLGFTAPSATGNTTLRFDSSTANITSPTNSTGVFAGSAAWTTAGEVEDYQASIANAVVRVKATNVSGTTSYTLSGNGVTPTSDSVSGSATSTSAHSASGGGGTVTVTAATPPAGYVLAGANLINTMTGASTPTTLTGTSVSMSTATGSDTIVEFVYAAQADAAHSTLTVTPTDSGQTAPLTIGTGTANQYTGAVAVKDVNGNTTTAPTTVDFTVTRADGSPVDSAKTVISKSSETTTSGSASFTITSTEAGDFKVYAKIGGTNISGSPTTVTWQATTPDAPVITTPSDGTVTNDSTPTIGGTTTGADGTTVDVYDGATKVCTATVSGGAWSCDSSSLADGSHTITATLTDEFGSVSSASTAIGITVDTGTPVAPSIDSPTTGLSTSATTVTLSGTAEQGSTVVVSDANGQVCTSTADATTGAWSCDASGLTDGNSYTYTATATDPAGNISGVSNSVTVNVDTTVPSAPAISTPADNTVTNDQTLGLTGTGEVGATITVNDGGSTVCSNVTVDASGNWSCTTSVLAEGSHALTATQSDAAGNVSGSSATVNVTVDTTAPGTVSISTPSSGTVTNDTTPTIGGTGGVAGDTIVVRDAGNNVICSDTTVAGDGTWSCVPTAALSGGTTYVFHANAVDAAGNVSAASNEVSVTVDTASPSAPTVDSPAEGVTVGTRTPTISGTAEANSSVTVTDSAGTTVLCTATADTAGNWSCDVPTGKELSDGSNTIQVTATDEAGNTSSPLNRTFTVDATADPAPSIDVPANASSLNTSTPTLSGTGVAGSKVTVTDANNNVLCADAVVAGDGTWSCTSASLADGDYTITATQRDATGNISPASTAVDFTIDTGIPAAPAITSPTDPTLTSAADVTVVGTGEIGTTITVSDGSGTECSATVTDDGSGNGVWTCDFTGLADGTYPLTATQTDGAGNTSLGSNTVNVTVDTSAPGQVSITAPADGSHLPTQTPTISGAGAEQGSTVIVKKTDGTELCRDTTVGADGIWSCVTATLPEGIYTVNATQIDAAGNVGAATSTVTFELDTTDPRDPVITSPATGMVTNVATVTVAGTAEANATVTVYQDGSSIGTTTADGSGNWSFDVTGLAEGSYDFTAKQTDLAGNVSVASNTVTVDIDRTADAKPAISTPANGTVTNDATPAISGTGVAGSKVTVYAGTDPVCTDVLVDTNGDWTCTSSSLVDGTYSLTATQTDPAGNTSAASDPVSITVDTVVPTSVSITAPAEGTVTNDQTPTFAGTGAEANATVVVEDANGNEICRTTVTAAGAWSCTPAADMSPSAYKVEAYQIDEAGNVGTPTPLRSFTIDTSAPASPAVTAPTPGSNVADTTPTVTGTAEKGSQVTVTDGVGTILCTATADPTTGAWSCTVPDNMAFTDGPATLKVTATDAAGNTSAPTQVDFTVDTTADAAPVIGSPLDGAIVGTVTPTISGTGVAGSTITVVDENSNVLCANVVVASDGTWSCTSATLPDGVYSLTATQTDAAGNISADSNIVDIVVDTASPSMPTITSPADGDVLNTATPTFTGTGEKGAGVEITVTDPAGNVVCTTTIRSDGTWSCTLPSALADGAHTYSVFQTDAAGNPSGTTAPVTIYIDTQAPTAPAINEPVNNTFTSDTTPAISGTGEVGSTVTVVNAADDSQVCTATVKADGTWKCPATTFADGTYTIKATQTDAASNESGVSNSSTFTIDTQAPVAPAITSPNTGVVTKETTVSVTGTAEAYAAITVQDGGTTACTTTADQNGDWSCDATGLSEGVHTFTAVQADRAGNLSGTSASVTLTVDLTADAAPSITSPSDNTTTNDTTPTFGGTGVAGSTISVTDENGTSICTSTVQSDGTWSCTPTGPLTEGDHLFSATQTDPAGNTSGPSSVVNVNIDTTSPALPTVDSPVAGSTTGDNTPTVSGTAEPGSTVTVTDGGGTVLCTATADASGAYSCTVSTPLPEGDNTLSVTATDPSGNTSSPTQVDITVDTTAGVAPGVTAPAAGSTVATNTPTFEGTGEAGSAIVITDENGDTVCTATVQSDGTWSCTPTGSLTEGEHTFAVTQTDPSGNTSPATSVAVTVDTTAPALPTVDSPVAGSTTGDNTPTVSGTAEPGSTVTVTDGGGTVLCTATADASGAYSCTVSTPLPEGDNTLSVTATDPSGNASPATSVAVTVDTTAPALPTVDSPVAGSTTGDNTPTVSGTAEPGSTVTVTDGGGTVLCTATADASGAYSCTVSTPLPEGDNTLSVTATDPSGNASPATSVAVTVDTTAPALPTVDSPVAGSTTGDNTPTVSGTAEPGSTVTVTDGGGTVLCTATADASGAYSCTVSTPLPEGGNTLSVTATDPSGNASPATSVAVTVDTTAPAAPVISGPTGDVATGTPTFTGTGEPGATVDITDENGNVVCSTTVASDGTWSCTLTAALAEGGHTFTATQTDPAGNTSGKSQGVDVTVDTQKPVAPVISGPTGATNDTTPTFTGTGEPGATVDITDENGNVVCSTTVASDGTWSCTPSATLTEGDHSFSATQQDASGNVSDPSQVVDVTVDTQKPVAPVVTSPADGDISSTNTPTVSGTAEPGSTVTVTDGGGTVLCTATADASGAYSCTVSTPLPEGDHTLSVTATDAAGNTSDSTTVAIGIDTTAPAAPVISGPTGDVATGTPTFTGTGEPGATVDITDENGNVVCSTTVASDGTWSCTLTAALAEGGHTFTATQTDPAGNTSGKSQGVDVTVDTQKPVAPVISGPTGATNDTTPTFTGTGEPGATVDINDENGNVVCSTTVASDGTWSCTPSATLTEGDHSFSATQQDASGNVSDPSQVVDVTVDTTAPAKPSVNAPVANSDVADSTPTVSGTGEPGASVTVTDGNGTVLCTADVQPDGSWSCTVPDALAFTDGPTTIKVSQTDSAGNTGEPTLVDFTVDTTAGPAPAIDGPSDGETLGTNKPTFTGTGEAGSTVKVTDENGDVVCTTTVQNDGTWECVLTSPLTEGDHAFKATQTDPAGNISPDTAPVAVTIDTTAPGAPVLSGPTGDVTTATPTFAGTGEPGATVDITDENGNVVCTTTVASDGTWSCTPASPIADGSHTFTASQTDLTGNESQPSQPVAVAIDTADPDAPIVTSPTSNGTTNDPQPIVKGTGEPGARVDVTDAQGNTLCTTTVAANGTWSCEVSGYFDDGDYQFTVVQTDSFGNVSEPTTVDVTVNTSASIGLTLAGAIEDANGNGYSDAGDLVTWTMVVTNTGKVTLTSVAVTDSQNSKPSCAKTTLLPGESTTCVGQVKTTVTAAHVAAGKVIDEAQASGSALVGGVGTIGRSVRMSVTGDVVSSSMSVVNLPLQAPPAALPSTGADISRNWIWAGVLSLGLGGWLLVAARRRREDDEQEQL